MSKTTVKNFALWARQALLELTGQEEAAYIWFNRIIAIRYMEVNGYLPEGCGDSLEILSAVTDQEEARRRLIALCNRLSRGLPELFPIINEKTERLLPKEIFAKDGVIRRLLEDIPGEEWKDAVEMIGWLHQYYHTEQKNRAFGDLQKQNVKISREQLPAVTQLFTPDWIVRYLVENSLGRLWLQSLGADTKEARQLKKSWRYYCDTETEVQPVSCSLSEIRLLDPCVGSGHILLYGFELFMQLYRQAGVAPKEAARRIVKDNLFGLDIDPRACRLSCFTIMMKARRYDPDILEGDVRPNVYAVSDSRFLTQELINFVAGKDPEIKCGMMTLAEDLSGGEEYGSLTKLRPVDLPRLVRRCEEVAATYYGEVISALYARQVKEKLLPLLEQARVMTQSYQVVVTNPPYMGKSAMDKKLREYVRRTFPLSNYDLYAVFIEKCGQMLEEGGYQGMITQQSWMFIRSYEKMRRRILQTNTIIHMAHLGTRAFEEISGEVVQTTAWIMQKTGRPRGPGEYVRLTEFGSRKEQAFLEEKETGKHGITYRADSENYFRIPGAPVAYWLSEKMLPLFETTVVSDFATVTNGMFTCDNKRFLRLWYELPRERIAFGCTSKAECIRSGKKWFPYNKGGNFRRWYGNQEYVINFENFGEEIREYRVQSGQSAVFPGQDYYFRESLSWSLVSPSKFGIRYYPPGFVFDIAGSSVFPVREEHLYSLLGTLAGAPAYRLLQVINPTINYQAGDIRSLPVPAACLEGTEASRRIAALAKENIALAKADWNSVETSWDFVRHPLVEEAEKRKGEQVLLKDCFAAYEQETIRRARRLSENEKEIDRLLEGIYGLPEEPESRAASQPAFMGKAEAGREARSLLSYAVGCMFKRFESEAPDKAPAVLLLTKEDILRRLKAFLAGHFGARTVEENLCYLAFAVMSDGRPAQKRIADPKEAEGLLLGYFRRNFFKDHQRLYQKRPIYWLVKSGGKGSYEALIYAHGYNGQTLRQIKASLEPIPDSPEKEAFREKLQALIEEAPRLDPEDGIAANRRKLQAILAD